MDRNSQRIESNYHSWHLFTGLTYRSCRQCRRHKEMTRRNAYANVQHPAIGWTQDARIRCGLPREEPNIIQPRQDHYIGSDDELYYDPPSPKYTPKG